MPFSRPTLAQIVARIRADVTVKLGTQASALRRAWVTIFSTALGGSVHLVYGYMAFAYKQFFADTAERDALLQKGAVYGFSLKAAEFAQGNVRVTGTNGTIISAGTVFKRSDGVRYEVDVGATISGAFVDAHVKAFIAGSDGNLPEAQSVALESPLPGVSGTQSVSSGGITGGIDEEDIEAFRKRFLLRLRNPPQGGSKADYKTWALQVPGVGDAFVYAPRDIAGNEDIPMEVPPNPYAVPEAQPIPPFGQVWIYISSGVEGSPSPSAGIVLDTQTYIDERKSATAQAFVFGVVPRNITFNIQVGLNSPYSISETTAQIEAELKDLFLRQASPFATVRLSQINEAISNAAGENFHNLLAPVADIVFAFDEIGVVVTPITVGEI